MKEFGNIENWIIQHIYGNGEIAGLVKREITYIYRAGVCEVYV